jgi:NAD(P)-dependent dehydrogenase (short-subunit alcohol dehydrogenase family)
MSKTAAHDTHDSALAVVTGGSAGFGRAVCDALLRRGWRVITDGRDGERLEAAAAAMPNPWALTAVAGDVSDATHRRALADAAAAQGGVALLVNNASLLGPSPQPSVAGYPVDALETVYAVNTLSPVALIQLLLPSLVRSHGRIVNLSSDAAAEAYQGWGGYGSSKAALDHLSAVLALEEPDVRVYAFDPGDMRTAMHQQAFPDEDISDRPVPETVVPAFLRLVDDDLPSGRYRAADLAAGGGTVPA